MARRGLSSAELKKKRDEKFNKLKKDRSGVKYEQNRKTNTGGGGSVTSTKTKSGKPKTKAQMMATKNIKKYGGTASAAAANKAAMKLKIKNAYLAKKKKKK